MQDTLKTLAHKVNTIYDFDNIIRNEEFYKLVIKHEAENFLLTDSDVEDNWIEFKKWHRFFATKLHPTDVRNLGEDYDF
jgi:hypothetical protein